MTPTLTFTVTLTLRLDLGSLLAQPQKNLFLFMMAFSPYFLSIFGIFFQENKEVKTRYKRLSVLVVAAKISLT